MRWIELTGSLRLVVFLSIRLLIAAACALVLVFAWRVFRPDSRFLPAMLATRGIEDGERVCRDLAR